MDSRQAQRVSACHGRLSARLVIVRPAARSILHFALAAIASDPVVCSGPKDMNSVLVCWGVRRGW